MPQPKFPEISVFDVFCFLATLHFWVNSDPLSITLGLIKER